jgi:hypothetical protein
VYAATREEEAGAGLDSTIAGIDAVLKVKRECCVTSVADPGCLSRIPDPNFFPSPGSATKNVSILTQKNGF